MTRAAFVAAPAALMLAACISLPPAPLSVKLFDNRNTLVGFVDILERKPGVRLMVHTRGLPAGPHGFHIHQRAKCEGSGFESAGDHFNPEGKEHGTRNPAGYHAGDLPNLTLGADDWADTTIDWPHVRLDEGDHGLFRNGGTSLVIHQFPDDELTDPSGNTGPRIACGVIVKPEADRF
jgi:Cu-Zn family superoxide dismutase